jgi:hypothetical protein
MGLRGPQSADLGALKLYTAQWAYLLLGLRDGHRDLTESEIDWNPWTKDEEGPVRFGDVERIIAVRIVSAGEGKPEKVKQVYERWLAEARKDNGKVLVQLNFLPGNQMPDTPDTPAPSLPPESQFGASGVLVFPSVSPRPDLWHRLKHPRSVNEVKETVDDIYRWMCDAGGILQGYRIPEDRIAELYRATRLWNYPGAKEKDRRSSENKRIEFFAKSLAGLMLQRSPAWATKKLCRWKIPQLWKS